MAGGAALIHGKYAYQHLLQYLLIVMLTWKCRVIRGLLQHQCYMPEVPWVHNRVWLQWAHGFPFWFPSVFFLSLGMIMSD